VRKRVYRRRIRKERNASQYGLGGALEGEDRVRKLKGVLERGKNLEENGVSWG